jgi:hypothetical protein
LGNDICDEHLLKYALNKIKNSFFIFASVVWTSNQWTTSSGSSSAGSISKMTWTRLGSTSPMSPLPIRMNTWAVPSALSLRHSLIGESLTKARYRHCFMSDNLNFGLVFRRNIWWNDD